MNTVSDPMLGEMFGDMNLWQAMLDRQRELFVEMEAGSRLGFVSREASGILPGKHCEGVRVVAEVPMMAWEIENGRMSARIERFAGISSTRVDTAYRLFSMKKQNGSFHAAARFIDSSTDPIWLEPSPK